MNNYYDNSNVFVFACLWTKGPGESVPTMRDKNTTGRRILLCGNQETEIAARTRGDADGHKKNRVNHKRDSIR
jgi:hypothetical protein